MKRSLVSFASFLLLVVATAQAALADNAPDFATLVQQAGPAVVNISTTQVVKEPALPDATPDMPDSPFNQFFRRYFGEDGPQQFDTKSLGSGFIISSDGYILTAAHVIENATQVVVKLTDRREFNAKVIGADQRSDVGLLKINATGLPTVKIGDPTKLRVGEWVLAIGAPFGFENSATAGIVSAKGRSLPTENYVPFIQTDVAINPGNSGGPLFNLKGEVVGINSQIYSRTGGFMGLSFSIPINLAMNIANQLRTTGHVNRGWLGITIQDVTRDLAQSFGMKKPHGALISDILPHSPAAKSDLRVGDVIVAYNDQNIDLSSDLPPRVGMTPAGTEARLSIIRNGRPETVMVTVGQLPDSKSKDEPARDRSHGRGKNQLGLGISDLSAQQKQQLGVHEGVLVNEIENGPALRAGIRPGDVIMEIDGKTVTGVARFDQIIKHAPKDRPMAVLIHRGSNSLFLALSPNH